MLGCTMTPPAETHAHDGPVVLTRGADAVTVAVESSQPSAPTRFGIAAALASHCGIDRHSRQATAPAEGAAEELAREEATEESALSRAICRARAVVATAAEAAASAEAAAPPPLPPEDVAGTRAAAVPPPIALGSGSSLRSPGRARALLREGEPHEEYDPTQPQMDLRLPLVAPASPLGEGAPEGMLPRAQGSAPQYCAQPGPPPALGSQQSLSSLPPPTPLLQQQHRTPPSPAFASAEDPRLNSRAYMGSAVQRGGSAALPAPAPAQPLQLPAPAQPPLAAARTAAPRLGDASLYCFVPAPEPPSPLASPLAPPPPLTVQQSCSLSAADEAFLAELEGSAAKKAKTAPPSGPLPETSRLSGGALAAAGSWSSPAPAQLSKDDLAFLAELESTAARGGADPPRQHHNQRPDRSGGAGRAGPQVSRGPPPPRSAPPPPRQQQGYAGQAPHGAGQAPHRGGFTPSAQDLAFMASIGALDAPSPQAPLPGGGGWRGPAEGSAAGGFGGGGFGMGSGGAGGSGRRGGAGSAEWHGPPGGASAQSPARHAAGAPPKRPPARGRGIPIGGINGCPEEGKNGNWRCPSCFNINFGHRNQCNRCQTPRG